MSLSDKDHAYIETIDEHLRAKATEYCQKRNALTQGQIEHLEAIREAHIRKYADDLNKIYALLHVLVDHTITRNETHIPLRLCGNAPNYGEPTLERWYDANPGAADAIFFVIDELEQKGWTPHIMLSETIYDTHACAWYGGNTVLLYLGVKKEMS